MTTTQTLRLERRRQKELERRRRIREAVEVTIFLIFALLAFGWAGAMDYQDDQAQLDYWQSQGVTIQRW